jgi:hypothetical protein
MYEWTREWLRLRREHSAIRRGKLVDLFYDNDAYVFARQDATETVIIAINRADKEKKVTLPVGAIGASDSAAILSLIGAPAGAGISKGLATVTLAKSSASAFLVR